jgi:hypothetical protein
VNEDFEDVLLNLLSDAKFTIICVVIDKQSHIERYAEAAYHPYHFCLVALLERYCGYLNYFNARGDVLAESRSGTADRLLKKAFTGTFFGGTYWRDPQFFQRALTSRELKLKKKSDDIGGLQLADLLAHPVKQEILNDHQKIQLTGTTFGERLCAAIQKKFNRRFSDGRIQGYGKVFLE